VAAVVKPVQQGAGDSLLKRLCGLERHDLIMEPMENRRRHPYPLQIGPQVLIPKRDGALDRGVGSRFKSKTVKPPREIGADAAVKNIAPNAVSICGRSR
jgi:hypothetical protein